MAKVSGRGGVQYEEPEPGKEVWRRPASVAGVQEAGVLHDPIHLQPIQQVLDPLWPGFPPRLPSQRRDLKGAPRTGWLVSSTT